MPKRYGKEFRRAKCVRLVAGERVSKVSHESGVSVGRLHLWKRQAVIDADLRPGPKSVEVDELVRARHPLKSSPASPHRETCEARHSTSLLPHWSARATHALSRTLEAGLGFGHQNKLLRQVEADGVADSLCVLSGEGLSASSSDPRIVYPGSLYSDLTRFEPFGSGEGCCHRPLPGSNRSSSGACQLRNGGLYKSFDPTLDARDWIL